MLAAVFTWNGCTEEGRLDHIDDSAPAPAGVENVTSIPIAGGAILRYNLPRDKNILYVKVEFETAPGEIREAKASLFKDSVTLMGYAAAGIYPVKIYSVGRNEKLSEPVPYDIEVLSPPVELVYPTLELTPNFGGIKLSYENTARGDLAMVVMIDTLDGVWQPLQTFYTNSASGSFSVRGLDTVEMKFGVYLRDRWNNKSMLYEKKILPIFEQYIKKDTWQKYTLPGDTDIPAENDESRYSLKGLWDEITNVLYFNIYASPHDQPIPMVFTIKLGKRVTISRIVVHFQANGYTESAPKKFELYGSDVASPSADLFGGDWNLLGRFQAKDKPDPVQPSDIEEVVTKGLSFDLEVVPGEIEDPWQGVQYIRFRTMETYKGPAYRGQLIFSELDLYGKILDM
jgi:hypothetical protein